MHCDAYMHVLGCEALCARVCVCVCVRVRVFVSNLYDITINHDDADE